MITQTIHLSELRGLLIYINADRSRAKMYRMAYDNKMHTFTADALADLIHQCFSIGAKAGIYCRADMFALLKPSPESNILTDTSLAC